MNTTVYLIRHSIRFNNDYIEKYNTDQNKTIKNEKIVLSVDGEKRAETLSNEKELQNIDVVYASNCVRTLQTAKYLIEKQKLKVNIDERLDERRVGKPNDDVVKNWFQCQYLDENYKTEGGESQKEVRKRFTEAFNEIIDENKGKRIAIFSHGYAITFFLMTWCKIEQPEGTRKLKITYNENIVMDKEINAPEVFKLLFDENDKIITIENIEFEDIEYRDGLGK